MFKAVVRRSRPYPIRRAKLLNAAKTLEMRPIQSFSASVRRKQGINAKTYVSMNGDKRAEESALMVRTLILGTSTSSAPKVTKAVAKPKMYGQVKSQLTKPKNAIKVIAHLRCLSTEDHDLDHRPRGPIHAVCLAHKDEEEQQLHFSKLKPKPKDRARSLDQSAEVLSAQVEEFTSVVTASIETLTDLFKDLEVISLIKDDFGLGQPGDGPGLLAGAVPTAETVISGIQQLTPQLMALGFAAGKTVLPDHTGVHPPTDRMSILTYWWGFELVLPPPSLSFLNVSCSYAVTTQRFFLIDIYFSRLAIVSRAPS